MLDSPFPHPKNKYPQTVSASRHKIPRKPIPSVLKAANKLTFSR